MRLISGRQKPVDCITTLTLYSVHCWHSSHVSNMYIITQPFSNNYRLYTATNAHALQAIIFYRCLFFIIFTGPLTSHLSFQGCSQDFRFTSSKFLMRASRILSPEFFLKIDQFLCASNFVRSHLAIVICLSVRPSVRPSVKRVHRDKTK